MSWRRTKAYRTWRAKVIRKDKVCQVCTSRKSRHAHHVNHAAYFQDQRFNPENGVCLCAKCHSQFHNNFKRSTREKCDRSDYDNFIALIKYIKDLNVCI